MGAGRTSRSSDRADYRVAFFGPVRDLAYNPAPAATAVAWTELWLAATLYALADLGR